MKANLLYRNYGTIIMKLFFWPRFNNKKEFDNSKPAPLEIDKSELHLQLSEIINEFDSQIQMSNIH